MRPPAKTSERLGIEVPQIGMSLGQGINKKQPIFVRSYLWSGQVMALDLRAQLNRTSVCFCSRTASWINSVVQSSCNIHGLHSDCMGNETEMDMADKVDEKDGTDK